MKPTSPLDCDLVPHKNGYRCAVCGRECPVMAHRTCITKRKRGQPCLHRGEQTDTRLCESCRGQVRIKIFACDIHGECTLAKPLEGVSCCATCREFAAG